MTKQEKEFKKAFRHKHVTNVEMIPSTLGSWLRIFFRHNNKKMYTEMRTHIENVANKLGNLKSPVIQYADDTKNYEYNVITYRVIG